jgi:hypothetical protein
VTLELVERLVLMEPKAILEQ